MRARQTLPRLWLLSDARNDAALERALRRLPRGSGLVFRHYHLPPGERRARFAVLARLARARGHWVILAASAADAARWGADGAYGAPAELGRESARLRIATAHSLGELAIARRAGADAVFLSPVFATRSHPGAARLGPVRFRLLAARVTVPVIALGGMTARSAKRLAWHRWGAIDGLAQR
ncbi:MAG: thiamine phosphate synthase [Croceibacterium sp.]